jgi:phosphotransferase system enzyme I (PtsI)
MKGISASKGIGIGKAFLIGKDEFVLKAEKEIIVDEEQKKLTVAIEKSKQQIRQLMEKTRCEIGNAEADIFKSHLSFLDDPEFTGAAAVNIEIDQISAVQSVTNIMNSYIAMFSQMEDEYIHEKALDIKDVGLRLLRNLAGKKEDNWIDLPEKSIIVAHDLTPSDTARLDKKKIVAFLTDIGGPTSHSAIMARALAIPSVVGLKDITTSVKNRDVIIVDGDQGIVFIDPDRRTLDLYEVQRNQFEQERKCLQELADAQTATKSGKRIIIAGNIGAPEDVESILANGAEGVGLFRTEFLYMNKTALPTEEEQFTAYKQVAEKMGDKPVIIRTLDIGGDKKLPYLPLEPELNPFLGLRAIRLCLREKEIFKNQLRAILRASAWGNVQVMFPMVSSVKEFLNAKDLLVETMEELRNAGIPFREKIPIGIMIEIPAAALCAAELAKYVDFFSIGTNDLIQYTIAVDRTNENVSYLYNPSHPAVLKLIKMTIDAAHREGKWCGMCGEMAGDAKIIPTLLEYGLDEFSMSAASILPAKKIVMNY